MAPAIWVPKLISLVLALALVALCGLAFADEPALDAGTVRIKSPAGLAADEKVTYNVYKFFDATSDGESAAISYHLVSGKNTTPNASFTVDTAGNVSGPSSLSAADIAAIAAYVADDNPVATIEVTGPNLYGYEREEFYWRFSKSGYKIISIEPEGRQT